jgi:hypothetical protein
VRQYDICRNPDRATRNRVPYFIVLQADLLSALATVIVAPVVPKRGAGIIGRLNPLIELDNKKYCVTMRDMAGIPVPVSVGCREHGEPAPDLSRQLI